MLAARCRAGRLSAGDWRRARSVLPHAVEQRHAVVSEDLVVVTAFEDGEESRSGLAGGLADHPSDGGVVGISEQAPPVLAGIVETGRDTDHVVCVRVQGHTHLSDEIRRGVRRGV